MVVAAVPAGLDPTLDGFSLGSSDEVKRVLVSDQELDQLDSGSDIAHVNLGESDHAQSSVRAGREAHAHVKSSMIIAGVATLGCMANEAMRDNWAIGAEGWVRHERIFDAVLAPFTAAILGAADLGSARRVLDVGCGAGTLLEAAVVAGADAVGVDISPAMVEAARRRVPTATVVTADAQTGDLLAAAPGEAFDRVVSRFGVMFFAEPEAAFANIRSAAAPGARLAFVCWREAETEMFSLGLRALSAHLADPPARPIPGTPGPLGLANADRIREVLAVAGWSDVLIEQSDGLCNYAIDGSDGVEERLAIALSGMVGRAVRAALEPRLDPEEWQAVLDEARAELRAERVDGAVQFVGHTWLVTATTR
jgi:SAM-dependent methyltransferase